MIKLFYILFFLLLSGCISKSEQPPEGILSKEKMIAYLIDLQITEAKIATLNIPQDTVRVFYSQLQQDLFRKHNIADSSYYKSLSYYLYDVKEMEDIYAAVVDSLSLRERLQNVN